MVSVRSRSAYTPRVYILETCWASITVRCENARRRDRAASLAHGSRACAPRSRQPRSSARRINSLTRAGLAFPPVAFITCPTRKPRTLVCPARYCRAGSGCATSTCSTAAASARFVADLRQPVGLDDGGRRGAAGPHLLEDLLGGRRVDHAPLDQIDQAGQRRRADWALGQRQPGVVERARHLAHQPVGRRLGGRTGGDQRRKPVAASRASASARSRRTADKPNAAIKPLAPCGRQLGQGTGGPARRARRRRRPAADPVRGSTGSRAPLPCCAS